MVRHGYFSSARVRLTLWNTLTLAFTLIALGVTFRFMAENYLLNALDREIRTQAQRIQEKHQVSMVIVTDKTPGQPFTFSSRQQNSSKALVHTDHSVMVTSLSDTMPLDKATLARLLPSAPTIRMAKTRTGTRYSITQNLGANVTVQTLEMDRASQFLYRVFDPKGKPLSPLASKLPFDFPVLPFPAQEATKPPENYRPWDPAGFQQGLAGHERLSAVTWEGASLRVCSQPLYETENGKGNGTANRRIIGVVQVAAPLGQVTRDIAGLTRALLLILPIALFVAGGTGVFLTHAALRPVKALARAASQIQPEQLSQRLPISGADEFDELAGTFNHALDRVEQTFREREQAMEQLRRFTADASHELRTPLTTIKANTGIALNETEPSQEHLHALRQIDRAADRMTALTRDLLLLARSDAGQITPDMRPLALDEVLQEAIREAEKTAVQPNAPITLQARESEVIVAGDADCLHRLFLNLLENAARYTPADGHITVSIANEADDAVIRVQDTGCGIGAEHLPHLGERFYRADRGRNRKQGGAGLGLAICHAIVAKHHGTLTLQSEPGEGTTVTVRLPLAGK